MNLNAIKLVDIFEEQSYKEFLNKSNKDFANFLANKSFKGQCNRHCSYYKHYFKINLKDTHVLFCRKVIITYEPIL